MLSAWTQADVQAWLAESLARLRQWKIQQIALCESFGWTVLPSLANFFVCRAEIDLTALRQHGIKLRDCTSFDLPGHVRISVQPPAAQDALHNACQQIKGTI
jgi:histidinol-phosphate aminotransferase